MSALCSVEYDATPSGKRPVRRVGEHEQRQDEVVPAVMTERIVTVTSAGCESGTRMRRKNPNLPAAVHRGRVLELGRDLRA